MSQDLPVDTPTPVEEIVLGQFDIAYSMTDPTPRFFWAAVAVAILATAVVASVDWFWGRRKSRRWATERVTPLAPKIVMAQTRGRFSGDVTVTTLIPAHNEEQNLRVTLPALLAQSRPPERIIVVADNCTDGTAEVARALRSRGVRDRREQPQEGRVP